MQFNQTNNNKGDVNNAISGEGDVVQAIGSKNDVKAGQPKDNFFSTLWKKVAGLWKVTTGLLFACLCLPLSMAGH